MRSTSMTEAATSCNSSCVAVTSFSEATHGRLALARETVPSPGPWHDLVRATPMIECSRTSGQIGSLSMPASSGLLGSSKSTLVGTRRLIQGWNTPGFSRTTRRWRSSVSVVGRARQEPMRPMPRRASVEPRCGVPIMITRRTNGWGVKKNTSRSRSRSAGLARISSSGRLAARSQMLGAAVADLQFRDESAHAVADEHHVLRGGIIGSAGPTGQRGVQFPPQRGGTHQEGNSGRITEEPHLVALAKPGLRVQLIAHRHPGGGIGEQPMHEDDRNLAALVRRQHDELGP